MPNIQNLLSKLQHIVRYLVGIASGIILCVLAFALYNQNLPHWLTFIVLGLYCAIVTYLPIFFYQRKLEKNEISRLKQLSVLRHDVKGILSPALLMADRILINKTADEKTHQAAEAIAESIERVATYLKETKK